MIDLDLLLRHAPNIGKCPVCRCSPATYVSEATGVKLCEACYVREVHPELAGNERKPVSQFQENVVKIT
jgi:hypothetical protein